MKTQFTNRVSFYTVYVEQDGIKFEGSLRVNDDNEIIELNGSYYADQAHLGNCSSYLNGEQLYFNINVSGAYLDKVFALAELVYSDARAFVLPLEGKIE